MVYFISDKRYDSKNNIFCGEFFFAVKSYESFSERFKKIVRGFIKILTTLQFGLSFNIIKKKIGLAQKKS
jgi:hypothetical protein